MFKRITATLLVLSLLTACAAAPAPANTPPPSMPPATTPAPAATPAPTASPTPSPTATPTATPAPTPSPVPTGTPAQETTPQGSESEKPEARKINSLHSWNPAHYTYHSTVRRSSDEIWSLLESLNPIADGVREEKPVDLLGFLIVFREKSGDRYDLIKESYYLTETQIYSAEHGVLDATAEQCKVLHDFAKLNNAQENGPSGVATPLWLCYMNPYSITKIALTGLSFTPTTDPTEKPQATDPAEKPQVTDISFTTQEPQQMLSLGRVLNSLPVQADSVVKSSDRLEPVLSDALMTIKITFSSGVIYDIYITDGRIDVLSSDMDHTLSYKPAKDNTVERFRLHAEDIYYRLHPELELPAHLTPNPNT